MSLKPFQETTRQAIKIEDGEQTRLSQRSFSEYARLKALEKETWELQEQAIQALKRENRELHEQLLRLNADRQALKQESQKLHEQVRRLNADLSEYKSLGERMTAVLQSLPNNKTTTASMLPVVPAATSESTITPSGPLPESDSIKRERIKEEDDEVHTLTATIRTSKRSKVIDLTLD
ncbi:hypothetical protein MMC07_003166 [Pseudocyphellaria aurata]|nr:hypothetical protein [Pseudocyphellaria aurata]